MTARVDGPYCAIHDAAHRPCDPRDPLDAGVLSSDAPIVLSTVDADRVAALIEERPGPTEAMRALFAERRPCAGWECDGRFASLSVGPFAIRAHNIAGDCAWEIVLGDGWIRGEIDPPGGIEAAQLAAEDALRAIAAEILRAVGR